MSGIATEPRVDRLQRGIYFRPKERPSPCYRLLLLNVRAETKPPRARAAVAEVWAMLQELQRGVVRDLRPAAPAEAPVTVPDGALTCLLGFGARLFKPELHVPRLVGAEERPRELVLLRVAGEGTPFPRLPWVAEGLRRTGEADLALQFIAETDLAVNRAIVETWKVIVDRRLPLEIVAAFDGFNRDDARSWIDFHDGINNIEQSQRQGAIEVTVSDPEWIRGGTYMAVLRVAVDLAIWRRVRRAHQEILVGRDKLTGCPLESVTRGPGDTWQPVRLDGCPAADMRSFRRSPAYTDPPRPGEPLLQASHIHRANHNRGAPDTDANNRIFRQGYEFLDPAAIPRLSVGLHFVSFQRNLARLNQVLRQKDWLGDVNFGGPTRGGAAERERPFLAVIAGGYYAVPPDATPFPGADLFPSR